MCSDRMVGSVRNRNYNVMASPGIPEFVESLGASRLLTAAQIRTLQRQLQGQELEASALARILVRQQHLTEWQASQLLKGQSGFVLDHYQLLNPVGRGGMGHVFRARDTRDQSIVAVKVMARKLTGNQTLVSRFQREIKASSRLRSSNIVRTLDAGRVGKVDFMVMEFVNGDQVDRIANRLGRLPVGLACELIRQIADGLQHAHQHQMVHRDIKPSNLMIHWGDDGQGTAKLMDMGLVLLLADNEDERTVTRAGQVMGTPDYMSPEQGWDTTHVDIRSDIYSLGCTLFRLLSGRIPFSGTNPLQVLSQRLQRDAPSLNTVCNDLPPPVVEVVERMTRRDPDARFQTPADVSAALRPFAEPLLKARFQDAARQATSDPEAAISAPDSDVVDEGDVTYRQFLAEVEDNSSVDLMLATDENVATSVNTLPSLQLNPTDRPGHRSADSGLQRRGRVSRRRKVTIQGLMAMGGLFVVLLLVLLVRHYGSDSAELVDTPTESGHAGAPSITEADPEVNWVPVEPVSVLTGQVWEFTPEVEVADEVDLLFSLGEAAPPTAQIDAASGSIRWPVPESQTPGEYLIEVRAANAAASTSVPLATLTIPVRVDIGLDTVRLTSIGPFSLAVGEDFRAEISVVPFAARELPLHYQLQSPTATNLKVDSQQGTLMWQPGVAQMGRHEADLSVLTADGRQLDQTDIQFVVMPAQIDHVLGAIPPQAAVAGQVLEVPLPLPADVVPEVAERRLIAVGPGGPAGVTVAPDSRLLRWMVPESASGQVAIPLLAAIDTGSGVRRRLTGSLQVSVDVKKRPNPAPDTPVPSTLPPADQIAKVVDDLKQTWRPRLASARTPQQKAALGWELLEAAWDSEADVTEAARLQLIEQELAIPARAVDLLLRIALLRRQHFRTDELADARQALKLFRRSSLPYTSVDVLVEDCLRLARKAIAEQDAPAALHCLTTVKDLARGNTAQVGGQLLSDVESVVRLCEELIAQPDSTTNDVRRAEISRLLSRWEFQSLFDDTSQLAFFGVREAGAEPVNGRGYWKIENGSVRLAGPTLQAAVGFTSAAHRPERYVVRLDVAPETTSAQLVIGATGTGSDFAAYGIVLDSSSPGRVMDIRNRGVVAEPMTVAAWQSTRSNRFEIVVDQTDVRVSVNGTTTISTPLPMLQPGQIGLAASLGVSEPRVQVRHVRLLPLPD